MGSLRALTAMLVLLVLVPAGVLAWLGFRAADLLEQEASARLRREFDDAEADLRGVGARTGRAFDAHLQRAVTEAARLVRRTLPLEGIAVGIERARDHLHHSLPLQPQRPGTPPLYFAGGLVALRLVDAEGNSVYPREYRPEDGLPPRPSWEGLFRDLHRQADRLQYGSDDVDGAVAVWDAARERLATDALRAAALAEARWIEVRAGHLDAGAAARGLERAFASDVLFAAGRPVFRLWIEAAPTDPVSGARLAQADRAGALATTPLTAREHERARAIAGAIRTDLPPDDPRTWRDWERRPSFPVAADVAGGAQLVAEVSETWAWSVFATRVRRAWSGEPPIQVTVRRPENVHPGVGAASFEKQREFRAPGWGGLHAGYVLVHQEADSLLRATRRRWLWTAIGVGALFALMVVGLVLVRRAVARERAARRLRDDFIANVSHELRTPLTSVCFHAEMLADEDPPPERRRHLARVVEAESARLASLVEDLLDFSALERGTRVWEVEPVNLITAARAAAEPYRVLAADEDVALSVEVDAEEVAVLADARALSRVLANLLANAWRHGRPSRTGGAGRIRVRVASGRTPVVEVRDDGPGIPSAEREAVFERFRRGAETRRVEGTGLGLALGRELARAMGGELAIVDDPEATVFRLTLPPAPPVEASDR